MDKPEARRLLRVAIADAFVFLDEGVHCGLNMYSMEAQQACIQAAEAFHKNMKEAEK